HPLNQAHFDPQRRRVTAGYGVLQPRVSFLYRTGLRSLFARLFAYSAGVDPYSAAVSDVYQDLFGPASSTAKATSDPTPSTAPAGGPSPANPLLSRDWTGASPARCGLVDDGELYDASPAKSPASARREHRWIRGDWQLLPWLGRRVPARDKTEGVPNPLPLLE